MAKQNHDEQRKGESDFDYAARRADELSRDADDSTYDVGQLTLDGHKVKHTEQFLGAK